jgi:hypothetical protein
MMRHFKTSNVLPADIHKQIFEVKGERAMNEGNMRKWCRLFKEGRKLCDMSPTVQEHYSKNSSGNFQVSSMQSHLAPGDYHLFLHHNTFLADQRPRSDWAAKDMAHGILKG